MPAGVQDAGQSSEGDDARRGARRVHPFFRDAGITALAQGAVAAGGLLLARLLATETGTDGFASYSLVKQSANFFFPIVTVGLVGGLPRYLALPSTERDPTAEGYLSAALIISGSAGGLAAALMLAAPEATAAALFGDRDADGLVAPFVGLLSATALFYVAWGYFRGRLRIRSGGALQVAGFAILPPAVVATLPDEPIETLIALMAGGLAAMSLVSILLPLARGMLEPGRHRIRGALRSLTGYGPRRVPGEVAQLGLFVLVPVLAAHVGSLTDVAYLSAGQQVLSILSLAVLPVGLVLLPALTRAWATDREQASRYVAHLAALAAHVALFVSLQTLLFADVAVRAWLGEGFDDAGSVVRVTVAPAALFVVYLVLRSTLDAVAVKSYNSRNNIIALGVLAAVAAVMLGLDLARPVMCVAWAFAAGTITQGALTFVTVHRMFSVHPSDYGLHVAVPLALAAGAAGLAARPAIDGSAAELPLLIAIEAILAAAYFGAIFRARIGWTRLLAERFFERT